MFQKPAQKYLGNTLAVSSLKLVEFLLLSLLQEFSASALAADFFAGETINTTFPHAAYLKDLFEERHQLLLRKE